MYSANAKSKVKSAETEVSRIMKEIKQVFPCTSGQGWNIPKFHGTIKMVPYMKLFESGIDFFSDAGESHHKHFVKAPGKQTQRCPRHFSKQCTQRVYKTMLLEIAYDATHPPGTNMRTKTDIGETNKGLSGKYSLTMYLDKEKRGSPLDQSPQNQRM